MLLLARGTGDTEMESAHENKDLTEQVFKVSSTAAACLLSDAPSRVNLVGYCDFGKMLTYRLDKESALILASAVQCPVPGSANAAGAADAERPTATIEHVTKLGKDEVTALARSLAAEWKAALTAAPQDSAETPPPKSAKDPTGEYWSEGRPPTVRRLVSEPPSPVASGRALAALRDGQ